MRALSLHTNPSSSPHSTSLQTHRDKFTFHLLECPSGFNQSSNKLADALQRGHLTFIRCFEVKALPAKTRSCIHHIGRFWTAEKENLAKEFFDPLIIL